LASGSCSETKKKINLFCDSSFLLSDKVVRNVLSLDPLFSLCSEFLLSSVHKTSSLAYVFIKKKISLVCWLFDACLCFLDCSRISHESAEESRAPFADEPVLRLLTKSFLLPQ
jgi:hypothetical protein